MGGANCIPNYISKVGAGADWLSPWQQPDQAWPGQVICCRSMMSLPPGSPTLPTTGPWFNFVSFALLPHKLYRAFSCDVMLSSNMAVSIATELNIHLCKHLFYIIVRNGISMSFSIRGSSAWWSRTRMVRVTALDIQVSLRNPTAMLEDSTTSLRTLNTCWQLQLYHGAFVTCHDLGSDEDCYRHGACMHWQLTSTQTVQR